MTNRFFKTNFKFLANRYEEWQNGSCISQGQISTEILAEVNGNEIHFELHNIDNISILKSFDFEILGEDFCILSDRIQYMHNTTDFNPIVPIVCHLFYNYKTIEYVRFAMTNPDRIVEFYGTLVEYGQHRILHRSETKVDSNITAENIFNDLHSYGMLNTDAIMERAVKLYNDNAKVANIEQAKAVLESLKLFVKVLQLEQEEQVGELSLMTPKILMFIALCNYKIGNINRAYCVAKQAIDAIDEAMENSVITGFSKSILGSDTLEDLISTIEDNHSNSIDYEEYYNDVDPLEINSKKLDDIIYCSKNDNNSNVAKPSKELIKKMIEMISQVQIQFDEVAEQLGDNIRGFQIRKNLETFKLPLFFAWQAYKYGLHTDWCEEGDSLIPFMMFEIDLKRNIKNLIDKLRSESPFALIEHNSAITNTLITIYTAFINDIDDGTIRI